MPQFAPGLQRRRAETAVIAGASAEALPGRRACCEFASDIDVKSQRSRGVPEIRPERAAVCAGHCSAGTHRPRATSTAAMRKGPDRGGASAEADLGRARCDLFPHGGIKSQRRPEAPRTLPPKCRSLRRDCNNGARRPPSAGNRGRFRGSAAGWRARCEFASHTDAKSQRRPEAPRTLSLNAAVCAGSATTVRGDRRAPAGNVDGRRPAQRPRTVRQERSVMRRITSVMPRPISGSATWRPSASAAALATTASET